MTYAIATTKAIANCSNLAIATNQHRLTRYTQVSSASRRIFIQRLFQVWQDLAHEATGHDTEWDYPVPLAQVGQALGIKEDFVLQLAQQETPELELLPRAAALTFHYPV